MSARVLATAPILPDRAASLRRDMRCQSKFLVPVEEIEPPFLSERDFKSRASTSSATRATRRYLYRRGPARKSAGVAENLGPPRPALGECHRRARPDPPHCERTGLASAARSAHCGGAWRGGAASYEVISMTDVAVKTNWSEQLRREPAVVAALVVFAGSAATILGAWYFQYVLGLAPCPLCLNSACRTISSFRFRCCWRSRRSFGAAPLIIVGFLAIIAAMLCSAALGAYHAGVEWRWWPGPTDCSGPMSDFTARPLLDQLRTMRIVRCDEAAWRFLGLSLAGYNALISLALAGIAALGLGRTKTGTNARPACQRIVGSRRYRLFVSLCCSLHKDLPPPACYGRVLAELGQRRLAA